MDSNAHRNELGAFLKDRRMELSAAPVGLPDNGSQRRIQALRGEEVVLPASISTDYHTRLEQGSRQASHRVLDCLAKILHLDDERAYEFELAGPDTPQPRRRAAHRGRPQICGSWTI